MKSMGMSGAMRRSCRSAGGYASARHLAIFLRVLATTNLPCVLPAVTPKARAELPALWWKSSATCPDRHRAAQHWRKRGDSPDRARPCDCRRTAQMRPCRAIPGPEPTHRLLFFRSEMDAHIRERALLERDLRAAIGGDALRPYYQPIVDLKSRQIVSFESLARWHNPVSGLILPDAFIPLAEELGILDMVSGQLFGDACRDAVTWPEYISLTFNFSPSQFSDRTFADAI